MFTYPCPDCGTTHNVHDRGCEYDFVKRWEIEKAYIDVISVLASETAERMERGEPPGLAYRELTDAVTEMMETGAWRGIHDDVLHTLKDHRRVAEENELGGLYLRTPEEREREIIPTFDPVRTVYEYGPVNGCKDYAVYTMVSWCEFVGLTWEQTRNFVAEWLEETGAWEAESWGENSIDELLNDKKHIHDRGLRFGGIADVAKDVIDDSGQEKRLDADAKQRAVGGKEDYDE